MKRSVQNFEGHCFDVVVIGGGVYGLCTAWDASLRGLSVALLEKDDFAHASSSANYKLIHGGLRYLQHLDFRRMRISICERRHMMTMAPHLVAPVEFIIPCYGHGIKGPEILRSALLINDLMGYDRNRGIEPGRRIPRGRIISADEYRRRIPGQCRENLTGGAVYHDAQMYSSERLALSFGRAAEKLGACLLNYAEVKHIAREGDRVTHLEVMDKVAGRTFNVHGNLFVNMTGPWSEITRQLLSTNQPVPHVVRSKGVQIFTRSLASTGFTVETRQKDTTAVIARGGRSLFIQPWRGKSFIGQSDRIFSGNPDDFEITEEDIAEFLKEFNEACPSAGLSRKDVVHWLGGMIPVGNDDPNPEAANISHRYEILDHEREDGICNMISAIGVKFTISRYIAEKVVDRCLRKLGRRQQPSLTTRQRTFGGDVEDVKRLAGYLTREHGWDLPTASHLAHLYGSENRELLALCRENPDWAKHLDGSGEAIRAEVIHAIREEMALHMDDVIIRRSDMGTLGYPGDAMVEDIARLMSEELGWDEETRLAEIRRVRRLYRIPTSD